MATLGLSDKVAFVKSFRGKAILETPNDLAAVSKQAAIQPIAFVQSYSGKSDDVSQLICEADGIKLTLDVPAGVDTAPLIAELQNVVHTFTQKLKAS